MIVWIIKLLYVVIIIDHVIIFGNRPSRQSPKKNHRSDIPSVNCNMLSHVNAQDIGWYIVQPCTTPYHPISSTGLLNTLCMSSDFIAILQARVSAQRGGTGRALRDAQRDRGSLSRTTGIFWRTDHLGLLEIPSLGDKNVLSFFPQKWRSLAFSHGIGPQTAQSLVVVAIH